MKIEVGKRYRGNFGYHEESLKIHSIYEKDSVVYVRFSWGMFALGYYSVDTAEHFKSRINAGNKNFLSIEI